MWCFVRIFSREFDPHRYRVPWGANGPHSHNILWFSGPSLMHPKNERYRYQKHRSNLAPPSSLHTKDVWTFVSFGGQNPTLQVAFLCRERRTFDGWLCFRQMLSLYDKDIDFVQLHSKCNQISCNIDELNSLHGGLCPHRTVRHNPGQARRRRFPNCKK